MQYYTYHMYESNCDLSQAYSIKPGFFVKTRSNTNKKRNCCRRTFKFHKV